MLGLLGDRVGAFRPSHGAGLRLWLDAGAMAGLADGAAVGTWADLSGGGHDVVQADPAKRPIYRAGVANGKAVVQFDGVAHYLQGAAGALSSPFTVLAVVRFDYLNQPAGDYDYAWALGDVVAANGLCSLSRWANDGGDTNRYYMHNGVGTWKGPVLAGQTWQILVETHRTAAPRHNLHRDGVAQLVADYAANLALDGVVTLGAQRNGAGVANWGKVSLGELMVYERALNDGERRRVELYLGAKWGIGVS